MNDYERIAQVIRYLDENHTEQPDLTTLAHYVGLSPHHFHRLFSQWAAITPKDFLQCLTLVHARELLREGKNVLDVALTSGLSGPGRLHDLTVNLEAASPGELKSGGEGFTLSAGFADCPFGRCLIAESPRGICHIAFVDAGDDDAAWTALKTNWPRAIIRRDDHAASMSAGRVFLSSPGPIVHPTLRAYVRGTAFQVKVWRALLNVPPGALVTYGRLAAWVGKPSAARAVGSAVGQNPIAYLIPCHRVIRETGVMGAYRWGPARKRAIVAWESAPRRPIGRHMELPTPGIIA